MSHPGPSVAEIVLTDDERAELVRRAGLPERRRADRARIILACAGGMSNAGAAQVLGVAVKSVSKWRRQFADQRLAGLEDAAPIGRPKAELVLGPMQVRRSGYGAMQLAGPYAAGPPPDWASAIGVLRAA